MTFSYFLYLRFWQWMVRPVQIQWIIGAHEIFSRSLGWHKFGFYFDFCQSSSASEARKGRTWDFRISKLSRPNSTTLIWFSYLFNQKLNLTPDHELSLYTPKSRYIDVECLDIQPFSRVLCSRQCYRFWFGSVPSRGTMLTEDPHFSRPH